MHLVWTILKPYIVGNIFHPNYQKQCRKIKRNFYPANQSVLGQVSGLRSSKFLLQQKLKSDDSILISKSWNTNPTLENDILLLIWRIIELSNKLRTISFPLSSIIFWLAKKVAVNMAITQEDVQKCFKSRRRQQQE